MEAFGLIGLFAVMQAWLSLFDMGMTPTLNREMARFTAGAHSPQSISDLLRTLEISCYIVAAIIAVVVWAGSDWLAQDWLKVEKLPTAVVAHALSVMALVIALRFVEGIYRGALIGLQRQVLYNAANAILSTLRFLGGVAVLAWVAPTIQSFFLWQALVSLLSIAVFAVSVHRSLPQPPLAPRFSRKALFAVWKFARGMIGISFLSLLLTQVDKVLLSRLLTLESFGFYALAATVAGVLGMVISPITTTIYPRMVEFSTQGEKAALVSLYHEGAQLVTILAAPAVMLLSFFPDGVVFMWSGDVSLAVNTAPILTPLVLGTFLNGLMWMPYQCQLAHGWTSLAMNTNVLAVGVLIPAIFLVVPHYGALGAAWIWVALNAGYVLITIQLMHLRLIPEEKWHWYLTDVLFPLSGALSINLLALQLRPENYQNRWEWFAFLLITGSLALAASTSLASRIRPRLLAVMMQSLHWRY